MKITAGLLALGALTIFSTSAQALTFDLNSVYTGATPGGGSPWATVSFTDSGVGIVDMVVSHNASSAAGQFVSLLELNVDPSVGTITGSAIGGKVATFNSVATGSFNDAGTSFDLKVDFNQANSGNGAQRLLAGDSVTIQLSGTGLSAANFDALSVGGTPVRSMMHIQGINGGLSGKVTEGVPEPASMVVLGGAALAAISRRKRK
jgi:hypothetical protein